VISQGEVRWASLPEPAGSAPGYRRPVVVVQGEPLNRSKLATVACVTLTSNLKWADAPGNVLLSAEMTELPWDSVALVAQVITLDKAMLADRCGKLPAASLRWFSLGLTSRWAAEQEVPITARGPTFSVTPRSDHAGGETPKLRT